MTEGESDFSKGRVDYKTFRKALVLAGCGGKIQALNPHNFKRLMTHMGVEAAVREAEEEDDSFGTVNDRD